MKTIFKSFKKIAISISDALKYADFSYSNSTNATGDTQLKLDILSDEIITKKLSKLKCIKALISEEKQNALQLENSGKYIIAYDPLDGSSLVDVNFAVGSIFGIYKNELCPQNLIASAYIIYGPRTELVLCKKKALLFRLNKKGKFSLVRELKLNEKGKLNATGGTQKAWEQKHAMLIKSLFDEGYRLRYSGAMVSDLHQILLKGGGLFSYPRSADAPNGKLRLAFEILPFAWIFEHANGATSDGSNDSLFDLDLKTLHQTSPCYFGSKYEINKVKQCLR